MYGPGYRPGGMFALLPRSLRRGGLATRLAWPGRISLVFVEDVVTILRAVAEAEVGRNDLFHVASPDAPRFGDLVAHIARLLGLQHSPIDPPWPFWPGVKRVVWLPGLQNILPFELAVALWRLSLIVSDGMVANSARLDAALAPTYAPLAEGLAATYATTVEAARIAGR